MEASKSTPPRPSSSPRDLPPRPRAGKGREGSRESSHYGSSPSSFGGAGKEHSEVKQLCARIKYSTDEYDVADIEIGFLVDQTSDKAWSKRVVSVVKDISFQQFDNDEKGRRFHRVKYIKQRGNVIWHVPEKHQGRASLGSSPDSSSGSFTGMDHFRLLNLGRLGEASPGCSPTAESPARASSEELLPDIAWALILEHLSVRDLCSVSCVSKHLARMVSSHADLWRGLYSKLFGQKPEPNWGPKVVKHVLVKSESRAVKWTRAQPSARTVGFASTSVLALDDSNAISGDGTNLRVWVHLNDRRIKTLTGHTANISCVSFDEAVVASGDVTGHLKLWSMDELKGLRSLRAHTDTITQALHINSLCITCSLDEHFKVWDASQPHPLVIAIDAGAKLYGMSVQASKNRLWTIGAEIEAWDLETARSCLRIRDEEASFLDPAAYYGYPVDVWPGTGIATKAVTNNGSVVASACRGAVSLYDMRSGERCLSWVTSPQSGLAATDPSAAACAGLHMDDWKLVTAFRGLGTAVRAWDIRAATSGRMRDPAPVVTLEWGGARKGEVQCLRVCGNVVAAGFRDEECLLWDFDAPVLEGGEDAGRAQGRQAKPKGKPARNNRNRRYPKRTTR